MKRIAGFEIVRFAMSVFILLHHAEIVLYEHTGLVASADKTFGTGYLTVEGFFLLSGLFLCQSIQRMQQKGLEDEAIIKASIASRFKSLLPSSAIAIGVCFVIESLLLHRRDAMVFYVANLLFLGETITESVSGNGLWYVTVLFWESLFFTWLLIKRNGAKYIWIPLISAWSLMFIYRRFGVLSIHNNPAFFNVISAGWVRGLLGLGVGISIYWACDFLKPYLQRIDKAYSLIFAGIELSTLLLLWKLLINRQGNSTDFLIYPVLAVLFILIYCDKSLLLNSMGRLARLGSYSYFIFLLHGTVIRLIQRTAYEARSFASIMLLVVLISMAMAVVMQALLNALTRYVRSHRKEPAAGRDR